MLNITDRTYQIIQRHKEHIKELDAENARLREINKALLGALKSVDKWYERQDMPTPQHISDAIALAEKERS